MKAAVIAVILFTIVLLPGCTNDAPTPPFVCDPSHPLVYADIAKIVETRCTVAGCHVSSNPYIPDLSTQSGLTSNVFDCKSQLSVDAMPPSGSVALTTDEKERLTCWIDSLTK